jgi:hypothetical protein
MIVKKTKQLGNFKRGINLYIPRRRSSSAPAGFPDVASTNQIAITNITGIMFSVANNGIGTYTKNGALNPNLPTYSPYYAFDTEDSAGIGFAEGRWYLFYWSDDLYQHATNFSSDPTTIPTTGWIESVTITAA